MFNKLPKKIITQLKILAIYQIVGGLAGFGITLWLLFQQQTFTFFIIFLFLIAILLYTLSLISGILLWQQKELGLHCSSVNQYLQLVNFSLLGYAFMYIAGAYITAGVNLTNGFLFTFNFGIMSQWQFTFNSADKPILLNLNIVALWLIIFINRVKKRLNEDSLAESIEAIGTS